MFFKEAKKAKELDRLIEEKKIKQNKNFAQFFVILSSLEKMRGEVPEISLPPINFAGKRDEKTKRTLAIGKIFSLKSLPRAVALSVILAVVFSLSLLYFGRKASLSGLNQEAIAKEMEEISNNRPTKSFETERKINNLINKKNKAEGLNAEELNSEMINFKTQKLKEQEIKDLLNSL